MLKLIDTKCPDAGKANVLVTADALGYDIKRGARGWYYREETNRDDMAGAVAGPFATARAAALHAVYGIVGEC